MARGFESKSVADQQEVARGDASPGDSEPRDPARISRLRFLQLSRADVRRRLEQAQAPAHREGLQRALDALDAEIARLG
jgi:hypothetical protein